MEHFLAQHARRLTQADAAALAEIDALERARPALSAEQLLAIVARSPSGRDLAARIGAPLARSVSLPQLEDAAAAQRHSEARRARAQRGTDRRLQCGGGGGLAGFNGPAGSAPASMTSSVAALGDADTAAAVAAASASADCFRVGASAHAAARDCWASVGSGYGSQ